MTDLPRKVCDLEVVSKLGAGTYSTVYSVQVPDKRTRST